VLRYKGHYPIRSLNTDRNVNYSSASASVPSTAGTKTSPSPSAAAEDQPYGGRTPRQEAERRVGVIFGDKILPAVDHHDDGHGHGNGHDDGGHHSHPLFHPPYNRVLTSGILLIILVGGVAAVMVPVTYQQIKGGFWFKKTKEGGNEKKH